MTEQINFFETFIENLDFEQNPNFAVSPISIYLSLSMLKHGATGDTRQELENVLAAYRASTTTTATTTSYEAADVIKNQENFLHPRSTFHLTTANGFFVMKHFKVHTNFITRVREDYHADVENVDFASGGEKVMNLWVEKQTNGDEMS